MTQTHTTEPMHTITIMPSVFVYRVRPFSQLFGIVYTLILSKYSPFAFQPISFLQFLSCFVFTRSPFNPRAHSVYGECFRCYCLHTTKLTSRKRVEYALGWAFLFCIYSVFVCSPVQRVCLKLLCAQLSIILFIDASMISVTFSAYNSFHIECSLTRHRKSIERPFICIKQC